MAATQYPGYSLETLKQARKTATLAIHPDLRVAASDHWAARSAEGLAGGIYPDNTPAPANDTAFVNANYRPWWALLKGCQNFVRQHPERLHRSLLKQDREGDVVRLGGEAFGTTFSVAAREYDAFVAAGDVLLPVWNAQLGTNVLIVRDGIVMAAIHGSTPSQADFDRARNDGTLPTVESDYKAGPTVPD